MAVALIAEDEPLLRRQLREALASLWPELSIVAECEDGVATLHACELHSPQIVFLDIRMPGMSGIDVARQVGSRCHVVFITAYDEHAVAAFEAGAVDYVMKPAEPARLATTVARLKERMLTPPRDLQHLLARLAQARMPGYLNWVQATVGNKLRLITVDEILCFQADAKYTRVLTRGPEALIRKPIKELVQELDPQVFWQIHRGTIVNIRTIDVVQRHDDGRMDVVLAGRDERFAVSQAYHHQFRQM
ncbi:MAG: LytTR family DNA-binding domain-containing protein [Casimicrobiaceae bacterium]